MNESYPDRGVNPMDQAEESTHQAKTVKAQQKLGTFSYSSLFGDPQGKHTAAAFRERLVNEGLAAAV